MLLATPYKNLASLFLLFSTTLTLSSPVFAATNQEGTQEDRSHINGRVSGFVMEQRVPIKNMSYAAGSRG